MDAPSHARGSRGRSIVHLTFLLIAGFAAVAVTVYFAVLTNCGLFCKNSVISEVRSPNGRSKAIRFSRKCTPPEAYCPSVTYVSIWPSSARLPAGTVAGLAIVGDEGITVQWKSRELLVVSYPAVDRILRRPNRIGDVRIQYLPIGFM